MTRSHESLSVPTDVGAPKLACRNIWKVYGPEPSQFFKGSDTEDPAALKDQIEASGHIAAACNVSFDVQLGEIFVIMGLSGSGKSTMIRCLSRLVEPTAGKVLLDEEDLLGKSDQELIEIRRHKMGMVFQSFGLLPHLTVLQNVAFPLKIQGISPEERDQKALEMIELVGLQGREQSFPRELSGGQQQRVGIARSLAVEPEIWFLDEPFSALDPLIRKQMQDEFLRIQKLLHKTIVFITHDFLEALRLADRIAIMKDGWVVQIGSPTDVIMNPASDYVTEFTQDAPRIKFITVGDIVEPLDSEPTSNSTVPASMTLDELLPHLAEQNQRIAVADESGKLIGCVTAQGVVKALAANAGENPL
jgi:glycine betaine/proline transport system ATP-binding protein